MTEKTFDRGLMKEVNLMLKGHKINKNMDCRLTKHKDKEKSFGILVNVNSVKLTIFKVKAISD